MNLSKAQCFGESLSAFNAFLIEPVVIGAENPPTHVASVRTTRRQAQLQTTNNDKTDASLKTTTPVRPQNTSWGIASALVVPNLPSVYPIDTITTVEDDDLVGGRYKPPYHMLIEHGDVVAEVDSGGTDSVPPPNLAIATNAGMSTDIPVTVPPPTATGDMVSAGPHGTSEGDHRTSVEVSPVLSEMDELECWAESLNVI